MSTMQEVNTLSSEQRSEILRGFKEAKAPLKHIKVMADLYDVSARAIKKVLIDAGIAPEQLDMRLMAKSDRDVGGPGVKKSRINGILAALRDERAFLESQEKDIPELIEKLRRELETIAAKKTAIDQSIGLLSSVEE